MAMVLEEYRNSEDEKLRTADLLRLLPRGRRTVLDVGARDGHFSRLLVRHFSSVTALDIERPAFEIDRVVTITGDATCLQFPSDSFDCVFCAEVLEHIADVRAAAGEISRVARHEVIIGVPYREDTRLGRTTCASCGKVNPPWGHVHSFDEKRLRELFPHMRMIRRSFAGSTRERTNAFSTWLMDRAGNPWGTYDQYEPCIHCGARLIAPSGGNLPRKICSAAAVRINRLQSWLARPRPKWIHVVFSKRQSS
jgi:SAM-dependent methyltransferase